MDAMRRYRWIILFLAVAALSLMLLIFASAPEPIAVAPTPTVQVTASPSPTPTPRPTPAPTPTAVPTPTPLADSVIAEQIQIPDLNIDLPLRMAETEQDEDFPTDCCAFILRSTSQPGRHTNSFIYAHAEEHLFKPLWRAELGQEVIVTMTEGVVLNYVITEIHPDVPCYDPDPPNPELNPEALGVEVAPAIRNATDCSAGVAFVMPTETERLTLQTSQGYNRNWGELLIIAEPVEDDTNTDS